MTWWDVAPGLITLAALWVLPGWAVARLLGARGLVALGAAAGITTAMSGVLAIGYDRIGVPWSLTTQLAGFAAGIAVAWVLGRLLGVPLRARDAGTDAVTMAGGARLTRGQRRALAVTAVVGAVALALPMMVGMGRADGILQAWDAVFHLNAMETIRQTGNASSLGGLAPMYADTIAPYYPAVWHGFVAVAPFFTGVTEAANASSIVLGTVVWLSGLIALARVTWPRQPLATVLTPIIAACFVAFPVVAFSLLAVWPFAVSVATLPGTLALLVVTLRGGHGRLPTLAALIACALAAAGGVLAHGSGLFSLILLATPIILVLLGRLSVRWWRAGNRVAVLAGWVVLLTATVLGTMWLVRFPPVAAIINYERGGADSYLPGVAAVLADHPLLYVYPIVTVNVATVLVLIGVVRTFVQRNARWLVLAWAAAYGIVILANGPVDNPLRIVAGFWYTQPSRIAQLVVIPAVVLAAGAAVWLVGRIRRSTGWRERSIAIGLVLFLGASTVGFRYPTSEIVMGSVYTAYPDIAWGSMVGPEELEMLDRAGDTLPDDAVVLGDPLNGSPFLFARSGVEVVYRQMTPLADAPAQTLLANEFSDWFRDQRVCEAVRELGVTHVYTDTMDFYDGGKYDSRVLGLTDINTDRPQFTLLDTGDTAALWEFTGCRQGETVADR